MTARLDPATALAYLYSLHADVRSAAVLGPSGDVLAGDRALAGRAGSGNVLSVADGAWSFVAEPGHGAVEGVLLADMRAALDALDRG